MQTEKETQQIKDKAFEILEENPDGLRYSQLHAQIRNSNPKFNGNTVTGSIWNLEVQFPDKVWKPSKGLFQLVKYKSPEALVKEVAATPVVTANAKIKEEDF